VKLLMTLAVRNEADVVGTQIAYHLNAGVDFVIALDHESDDGTTEILEAFEREGRLRLLHDTGPLRQSAWRTRMAQLAATEYGADWIINTDADEFWWPRGGEFKDVLAAVPDEFGVVWAPSRHFVPRPDDERPLTERMTARLSAQAPINDPTSPFRPHAKVVHRAEDQIVVQDGAHSLLRTRLRPLRNLHPVEVLHFPYRSLEQYQSKNLTSTRTYGSKALAQYTRGFDAYREGRIAELYRSLVVDDERLAQGLADGSLVLDVRLRDAVKAQGSGGPPRLRAVERAALAVDAGVVREANIVRLQRRLDELAAREAVFEQRLGVRSAANGGETG
jgi:Glycosyl transferase family 2